MLMIALPAGIDPRSWPWTVWVFCAIVLLANAHSIWKWYRKRRAMTVWIITSARVDSTAYSPPSGLKKFLTGSRNQTVTAKLNYSYVVEGEHYRATFERAFTSGEEASDFIRGLEGQTVSIRFDPNHPSDSLLPDEEVTHLLESRPPSPEAERAINAAKQVPGWVKPLLWPFVLIAALGLVLSITVHIAALFGHQLFPMSYFVLLHIGIFVVWFPTVLVAQKTQRGSDWKSMFRNAPAWMSGMTAFFFIYAGVNFVIFLSHTQGHPHDAPGPVEWRGFSGHWMVFYSAALSTLYSAASAKVDSANQVPYTGDRDGRYS